MPEGPGPQVHLPGPARAQPSPSSLGYGHDTHHQGLPVTTCPSKRDKACPGLPSGGPPSPEARTGPGSSVSPQAAPAPGPSRPLPPPSTPPAPNLSHPQPGWCRDPTASRPLAPPGLPELPGTRAPSNRHGAGPARSVSCVKGVRGPLGGDAEVQAGEECVRSQTQALAPQLCGSQSPLGRWMEEGSSLETARHP